MITLAPTPSLSALGAPALPPLAPWLRIARALWPTPAARGLASVGIDELDDHLRRDIGLPRGEARRADARLFDLI